MVVVVEVGVLLVSGAAGEVLEFFLAFEDVAAIGVDGVEPPMVVVAVGSVFLDGAEDNNNSVVADES